MFNLKALQLQTTRQKSVKVRSSIHRFGGLAGAGGFRSPASARARPLGPAALSAGAALAPGVGGGVARGRARVHSDPGLRTRGRLREVRLHLAKPFRLTLKGDIDYMQVGKKVMIALLLR